MLSDEREKRRVFQNMFRKELTATNIQCGLKILVLPLLLSVFLILKCNISVDEEEIISNSQLLLQKEYASIIQSNTTKYNIFEEWLDFPNCYKKAIHWSKSWRFVPFWLYTRKVYHICFFTSYDLVSRTNIAQQTCPFLVHQPGRPYMV